MLRLDKIRSENFMYAYTVWPGAYSFKEEIGLFITFMKEQIDDLLKKIEETERAVEEA